MQCDSTMQTLITHKYF